MLNASLARRQRGLSFVELAITLALAAILAGAAVPSFAIWQGNTRIRASADTIHAGLRLARAEAVTRNTSVTFTLQSNGSWSVSCTTVTATCPANIHSRPGAEVSGSLSLTYRQFNDQVASGAASITFNSLGIPDAVATSLRRVDIDVPTSVAPSSLSRDLRLIISDFGQSRLCDPNAAGGTPTACS